MLTRLSRYGLRRTPPHCVRGLFGSWTSSTGAAGQSFQSSISSTEDPLPISTAVKASREGTVPQTSRAHRYCARFIYITRLTWDTVGFEQFAKCRSDCRVGGVNLQLVPLYIPSLSNIDLAYMAPCYTALRLGPLPVLPRSPVHIHRKPITDIVNTNRQLLQQRTPTSSPSKSRNYSSDHQSV